MIILNTSAIQLYQIDTGTWPGAFGQLSAYIRTVPSTCPGDSTQAYTFNAGATGLPYAACPDHGNL